MLGASMTVPTAFDEIGVVLDVDDFYLPAHRDIYAAMQALQKRRVPIDFIALTEELKARGVLARLDGGESSA